MLPSQTHLSCWPWWVNIEQINRAYNRDPTAQMTPTLARGPPQGCIKWPNYPSRKQTAKKEARSSFPRIIARVLLGFLSSDEKPKDRESRKFPPHFAAMATTRVQRIMTQPIVRINAHRSLSLSLHFLLLLLLFGISFSNLLSLFLLLVGWKQNLIFRFLQSVSEIELSPHPISWFSFLFYFFCQFLWLGFLFGWVSAESSHSDLAVRAEGFEDRRPYHCKLASISFHGLFLFFFFF